ncbi:MAG TPA: alpha/beta hydrolase [Usitatibacter sp.]|nr:alpha/beta hydrolase [Usitatibacter sp.]
MPQARCNGLTLEYEALGDASRPAVVLVMGLGLQMIYWPDELCRMLVARGFRVVRFDNRDIGLSTALDHLGKPSIALQAMKYALHLPMKGPYRIDDMANDTLGLLDALGIRRAHLVGASMGGMISQNLAARVPERVISLTSIMSTTGCRKLPPPTARARRALLQAPARKGDYEGAVRRMVKVLRAIGSKTYPADEGELRAFCERHVSRSYNPAGAMRQLVAIAASGDRTEVVKRIRVPTLVIHGDEDPLLKPPCGEETARVIREAGGDVALEIVRGMGHDLPRPLLEAVGGRIAAHCGRAAA